MLVMGVADLPASIAGGACVLQPGCGFPMNLAEVSAKGRPEEAYPVLVLGTQVGMLGTWDTQCSEPYSRYSTTDIRCSLGAEPC